MKIHFVRHGETDWNADGRLQGHSPSRLSAKGQAEARTLANKLPPQFRNWPVYASDLQRTVETARLLYDGECPHLITSPLLREIALGRWQGRLKDEVQADEPELYQRFKRQASQFSIDGGESFRDVQQRGLQFLQQLRETEHADEVLVVSHRGLIKSVLSYYENRSLDDIWDEPTIPNCSISTIEMNHTGVEILAYAHAL